MPVNRHPDVIGWQDQFISDILDTVIHQQPRSSISRMDLQREEEGSNNDDLNIIEEEHDDDSDFGANDDHEEGKYGDLLSINPKVVINRLKSLSLVIFDTGNKRDQRVPIERFVIDLSELKIVNPENLDKEFQRTDDLNWELVYEQFKSLIFDLLSNLRKTATSPNSSKAKLDKSNDNSNHLALSSTGTPSSSSGHNHLQENPDPERFTYDVFLETDKNMSITNYDLENKWILDPEGIIDDKKAVLSTSARNYGHNLRDSALENDNDRNSRHSQHHPELASTLSDNVGGPLALKRESNNGPKRKQVAIRALRPVEVPPLNVYCRVEKVVSNGT